MESKKVHPKEMIVPLSLPSSTPATKVLRFLVVDDVSSNRKMITHMVTGLGHTTVEAFDGLDALLKFDESQAQNKPFDAVFMDFVMPSKSTTVFFRCSNQ